MSCQGIRHLLRRAQDVPLSERQRGALTRHVAGCAACRRYEAGLAKSAAVFRADAANAVVPALTPEIRAVQARLSAPRERRKRKLTPVFWLGAPLAATAAVVFAFLGGGRTSPHATETPVTHVDYVVTGDPAASTMVYVDQDSGWLVVWANDPSR